MIKRIISWSQYLSLTLFSLFVACQASANLGAGIFIDENYILEGQNPPGFSATLFNTGGAINVDLHIGVLSPSGIVYEFPDWNTEFRPVASGVTVPPNFELPLTSLGTLPSLGEVGVWTAFAVMAQPGTLNLLSLDLATINVVAQGLSGSSFGALHLSYWESSTGDDVDAGGSFVQSSANLEQALTAYEGSQPALEQCVFNTIPIDFGSIPQVNFTTLDAGPNLLLSSTGVSTEMPKDAEAANFGYILYSPVDGTPAVNFYQGGMTYNFQGFGGPDIASFSVPVMAPSPLDLTQPDISNAAATHNSATALPLAWSGNNGVGEVNVTLAGSDLSNSYTIECRFVDDGSASVPSNLLVQLRDSLGSNGFEIPDIPGLEIPDIPGLEIPDFNLPSSVVLDVSRTEYSLFNTGNNDLSYGIATIDAGASMSLTLQ